MKGYYKNNHEVVDGGVLEHLRVGFEGDPGAGDALGYRADALEVAVRVAAPEGLLVLLAVAAHIDGKPLGTGVDHRSAHAVQAAGHLVAGILAAELAAGVQDSCPPIGWHEDSKAMECKTTCRRTAP